MGSLLDGELRAADGQGTVDLSIKGRRRLGLFPGPVQAINFRNVPLDVARDDVRIGLALVRAIREVAHDERIDGQQRVGPIAGHVHEAVAAE